ncbi:MAG: sporulation protein YqfD [Oscillospiraceae bacterium]|nr:sporulation protein YqfD [Oscillospiraceae bacterium]
MGIFSFFNRAAGWSVCKVSGAVPAAFLNRCAAQGVALLSVAPEDAFTLTVRLSARDVGRARRIAQGTQCTLCELSSGGALRFGRRLLHRGLAVLGLLFVLICLMWSKLYIWEIEVTGNETVSTARILAGLRECGVDYGSFWPGFTSDNLRSELLTELPELSWATVNIYGSRAEVIVRERVPKPELWQPELPVDVVAGKDGYVTRVLALNGTALARAGSAVVEGETLISAAAESAYAGTRLVHAIGSVTAQTYYELSAAVPLTRLEKTYTGGETGRWALVIGKNRWNFYGNSSIYGDSCDKIETVWSLRVGGLFALPVSLVREVSRAYTLTETARDQRAACSALEQTLYARLLSELGADGAVERVAYSASASDGVLTVCLRAICTEEIGTEVPMSQAKIEEIRQAQTEKSGDGS